jgi:hypothetical protein
VRPTHNTRKVNIVGMQLAALQKHKRPSDLVPDVAEVGRQDEVDSAGSESCLTAHFNTFCVKLSNPVTSTD